MRNIADAPTRHQRLPRAGAAALVGAVILALAAAAPGCGRRDQSPGQSAPGAAAERAAAAPAAVARHDGCGMVVDATGLQAYSDLAARLGRGEAVTVADFRALARRPAYAALLGAVEPQLLNAGILENVTRHLFASGTGARGAAGPGPGARRANRHSAAPKRQDLVDALRWSCDRIDSVNAVVAAFAREEVACTVPRLLAGYVRESRWPDTLRVSFLLAGPDLRWAGGRVVVDGGLALAAGAEHLPRLVAAQLYRALEPREGPEPAFAGTGKAAVAAACDRLRHEGVAAWLEGWPDVRFAPSHPLLGGDTDDRSEWARVAAAAIAQTGRTLEVLMADRASLDERGTVLDDLYRGNRAYAPTGYAMAAVIAVRLGEARLRACAGDTPAFFRAYQEAAGRSGADDDAPPRPAPAALDGLRPLPEPVFAQLIRLLDPRGGR